MPDVVFSGGLKAGLEVAMYSGKKTVFFVNRAPPPRKKQHLSLNFLLSTPQGIKFSPISNQLVQVPIGNFKTFQLVINQLVNLKLPIGY